MSLGTLFCAPADYLSRLHPSQVLSPAMLHRASHFGSKVALDESEWQRKDKAYFDAPGKLSVKH